MEVNFATTTRRRPCFIEVEAGVRYWDDATINGVVDEDGKVPLRKGDCWCPVIELATGRVVDWPEGVEALIHYKVCDEGSYWLLDDSGNRVVKWKGYYVPGSILCPNEDGHGFGDYIILKIDADGKIADWRQPVIDPNEWELIASITPS